MCSFWTLLLFCSLGVVEAASSSLVTQTSSEVHNEPPIFFYFLAKSLEISRFRDNEVQAHSSLSIG